MKVKLMNYTQDALELLLYTKNTRLQGKYFLNTENGRAQESINSWPEEKKMEELDYMLKTIQSSWEFVDYTFEITGVSRAFTHQLVRTRQGSYAQQSQRTVDVSGFDYVTPDGIEDLYNLESGIGEIDMTYHETMSNISDAYSNMIEEGIPPQDVRGILPTNICTNIIAKFNLRVLSDMAKKRLCTRTQGEYQNVFKEMKKAVLNVHPWAEKFIRVYCSAVGVCQFPNYKECPLKPDIFNPDNGSTWRRTNGYEMPKDPIILGTGDRPATKEEIEAGYLKMGTFESAPKHKGNS